MESIVLVEVNSGGGIFNLTIGDKDTSERVSGPKAWGGSRVVHQFQVKTADLIRVAAEYGGMADPQKTIQSLQVEIATLRQQLAVSQKDAAQLDEIAALIRRLVRALRKASPGAPVGAALDYLKRKGLSGSFMRDGVTENEPDHGA